MGLFDFFKKKQQTNKQVTPPPVPKSEKQVTPQLVSKIDRQVYGKSTSEYLKLTKGKYYRVNRFFIAFDLETTGLSAKRDRIIEIGAVVFEQGKATKQFSTLVNPGRLIPSQATKINGITNSMVRNAPDERTAIMNFLSFCDQYSQDDLIFVSHNGNFDFSFLTNTLNRLGITRHFKYFDTLSASRSLIDNLSDYKQKTVAKYFGIRNKQAHRATSDARVCGKILLELAPRAKKDRDEFVLTDKNIPSKEEMIVCAYLQNMLISRGANAKDLTYYKNRQGYVTISCFNEILQFKFAKKGHYLIVEKSSLNGCDNPSEDCTQSEGGLSLCRVFFSHPTQLECFGEYIYQKYIDMCSYRDLYFKECPEEKKRYFDELPNHLQLSIEMMDQLMSDLSSLADTQLPTVNNTVQITRDMVTIDIQVTRKPLDEIKNKKDWQKGYEEGFSYYEQAEILRKKGSKEEILSSISLLDLARNDGYLTSELYEAYGKAYRKLKDYQNEILICEEGIEHLSDSENGDMARLFEREIGVLEARKNKAIQLLYKQQNPQKERK